MTYRVTTTAGAVIASVLDGTVNTTATSLTLIGKNYAGYGIFLNENYVQLLENFSNANPPTAPLTGQLWYDTANDILKVYNSETTLWKPISSSIAQATAPSPATSVTGDLWWDTVNAQLKVFSGSAWITIGPVYTTLSGTSGPVVEQILDTLNVPHIVTKFYISNSVIAILSKDQQFIPQVAIPGFPEINPGLNLINQATLTNAQFTGIVTNSQRLNNIFDTQFLRKDQPETTSFQFTAAGGLTVGSDLIFDSTSPSQTLIRNTTTNKNLRIDLNRSGVQTTALTLTASTNTLTVANAIVVSGPTFISGITNVSADIQPTANISYNLGTTGLRFNALHAHAGGFTSTLSVGGLATFFNGINVNGTVTATGSIVPSANVNFNLGSVSAKWQNVYGSTFHGTAIYAQYADLAERFAADNEYPPGTVMQLGGAKEITAVQDELTEDVFGVISTKAGFLLNGSAGDDASHPPIAMSGRVPVRVIGQCRKGDRLVSAGNGLARAAKRNEITAFNVIGRALEDKYSNDEGSIEAIVKLNS